jgi:hypothetical protein
MGNTTAVGNAGQAAQDDGGIKPRNAVVSSPDTAQR